MVNLKSQFKIKLMEMELNHRYETKYFIYYYTF